MRLAGKAFQNAAVSRDLPIPASPERSTTWPSPFTSRRVPTSPNDVAQSEQVALPHITSCALS